LAKDSLQQLLQIQQSAHNKQRSEAACSISGFKIGKIGLIHRENKPYPLNRSMASSSVGLGAHQHTPFQLWEAFVRVLMRDPAFMMCLFYPLGIFFLDHVAKTVRPCRLGRVMPPLLHAESAHLWQNKWGDLAAKGTRLHLPHKYFNLTYNVVMSLFSLVVTVAVIDVMRRLPIMSNDCQLYACSSHLVACRGATCAT
jgi:hypothetical protein